MKQRWYKPEETSQMACPLSVGQAEAGRYTFCVNQVCMAWQWMADDLEGKTIPAKDSIPDGWAAASEVRKEGKKEVIDIVRKPTHGRCGMVPM